MSVEKLAKSLSELAITGALLGNIEDDSAASVNLCGVHAALQQLDSCYCSTFKGFISRQSVSISSEG